MLVITAFYLLGCFSTPKTRNKVQEKNPPWWSRHALDRTLLGTAPQAERHTDTSLSATLKEDSKSTREGRERTRHIQATVSGQKQSLGTIQA